MTTLSPGTVEFMQMRAMLQNCNSDSTDSWKKAVFQKAKKWVRITISENEIVPPRVFLRTANDLLKRSVGEGFVVDEENLYEE